MNKYKCVEQWASYLEAAFVSRDRAYYWAFRLCDEVAIKDNGQHSKRYSTMSYIDSIYQLGEVLLSRLVL